MRTLERYYEKLRDWPPARDAEAIDITAAAKWYWDEAQLREKTGFTQFPACITPYSFTWMEYDGPSSYRGEKWYAGRHWRSAVAATSLRVRDTAGEMIDPPVSWSDRVLRYMAPMEEDHEALETSILGVVFDVQSVHWVLCIVGMLENVMTKRELAFGPLSLVFLDEHGAAMGGTLVGKLADKEHGDFWLDHYAPFLFALSLMNAKNVSIVAAPLPPKVLKRREKEGKPALTFKTLHIEPMRQRVKREKQEGESEVKRALHLCRGHFKDYRESGGLFGKYKGLYWWDSQVRGTDEAGRIIKDYTLGGPSR